MQSSAGDCAVTHPYISRPTPEKDPEEERASAPPAPSSNGVIETQEHVAVVEAEVLAAHRTIEPPLGCAQHPNGTTQPCRQCGNAIKKWESSPEGIAFMRDHVMATEIAKQLGKQAARDNQAVLLRESLRQRSVEQMLGSRPSDQSRQLPSRESPPPKAREKPAIRQLAPASVTNNSPYRSGAQQMLDEAKARGERLRAEEQARRNNSDNHRNGETP